MSSELKLSHYSLENCVAAVMRKRVPHVGPAVMTAWFNAGHAGWYYLAGPCSCLRPGPASPIPAACGSASCIMGLLLCVLLQVVNDRCITPVAAQATCLCCACKQSGVFCLQVVGGDAWLVLPPVLV